MKYIVLLTLKLKPTGLCMLSIWLTTEQYSQLGDLKTVKDIHTET